MPEQWQQGVLADEASLLERVGRQEEEAIERLYRAYADDVLRFVYRRVGESRDAEEITQDTFLTAVRLARGYRGDASVITWLCAIAKVRITDFYRRRNREKRVVPDKLITLDENMPTPDHLLERIEAEQMVEGLMSCLTDDEREAVTLHYVEGFSVREISKLMCRTEKGIESLLTRAKRKQRAVASEWFDERSEL